MRWQQTRLDKTVEISGDIFGYLTEGTRVFESGKNTSRLHINGKTFPHVEEEVWYDFHKKYRKHEFQEMIDYRRKVFVLPLFLGQHEKSLS